MLAIGAAEPLLPKGVSSMVLDPELRPYQTGDEASILQLFSESFGQDLSVQEWAWRFRDNPAGPGLILLGWDGNALAAHYAVTTVTLRIEGQDRPTGLSGTTMTHPDHRGRGLFPILARSTYERMADSGMAMVWGFPNAMSHRGFVKDLQWVDIYEVPTLRLGLPASRSLPTSGADLIELQNFDHRFDQLWELVRDDYPVMTRRDQQHLKWRYLDNLSKTYRILVFAEAHDLRGYVVFKTYKEELQIVDILSVPDVDVGVALVSGVAMVAAEESATSLGLWLNVTHPLHRALERLGFQLGEPITYFGGLALQSGLEKAGVYDFKRWHLTMGDSDVF